LFLAVPVLVVAVAFQKTASAAQINVTNEYQEAMPNLCAPYKPVRLDGSWVWFDRV
jgi:hypothetical protein